MSSSKPPAVLRQLVTTRFAGSQTADQVAMKIRQWVAAGELRRDEAEWSGVPDWLDALALSGNRLVVPSEVIAFLDHLDRIADDPVAHGRGAPTSIQLIGEILEKRGIDDAGTRAALLSAWIEAAEEGKDIPADCPDAEIWALCRDVALSRERDWLRPGIVVTVPGVVAVHMHVSEINPAGSADTAILLNDVSVRAGEGMPSLVSLPDSAITLALRRVLQIAALHGCSKVLWNEGGPSAAPAERLTALRFRENSPGTWSVEFTSRRQDEALSESGVFDKEGLRRRLGQIVATRILAVAAEADRRRAISPLMAGGSFLRTSALGAMVAGPQTCRDPEGYLVLDVPDEGLPLVDREREAFFRDRVTPKLTNLAGRIGAPVFPRRMGPGAGEALAVEMTEFMRYRILRAVSERPQMSRARASEEAPQALPVTVSMSRIARESLFYGYSGNKTKGFITRMAIADFLQLTATGGDVADVVPPLLSDPAVPLPVLKVEVPTGQVIAHDSRAEVLGLLERGCADLPVLLSTSRRLSTLPMSILRGEEGRGAALLGESAGLWEGNESECLRVANQTPSSGYRHPDGALGVRMDKTHVRSEVDNVFGYGFSEMLFGAGLFDIVQEERHLPAHLQLAIGGGVAAVFDPLTERTWLVADNIRPDIVRGLVIHNLGVHYGMDHALGEQAPEIFRLVRSQLLQGDAVVSAVADAIPLEIDPVFLDEMLVAHLVANPAAANMPAIGTAINRLQLFLKSLGSEAALTAADVAHLAEGCLKRADDFLQGRPFFTTRAMEIATRIRAASCVEAAVVSEVGNAGLGGEAEEEHLSLQVLESRLFESIRRLDADASGTLDAAVDVCNATAALLDAYAELETCIERSAACGRILLTPSAKEEGAWQVTWLDRSGQPICDSQRGDYRQALELFWESAFPESGIAPDLGPNNPGSPSAQGDAEEMAAECAIA